MTAKFTVEESVTKYINQVKKLANDTPNTRSFLKTAAKDMHFENILPLMPAWNPNLIYSPMMSKNQRTNFSTSISTLDLIYTGFTGRQLNKVFREFGDVTTGMLDRDYAFYQETGQDDLAPTFEGHWFVRRGTMTYQPEFNFRALEFAYSLLRLQKWKGSMKIDLYDFEETFESAMF